MNSKQTMAIRPWQAAALGLALVAVLLTAYGALPWAAIVTVVPVALSADRGHRRQSVRKQVAALPGGDPR